MALNDKGDSSRGYQSIENGDIESSDDDDDDNVSSSFEQPVQSCCHICSEIFKGILKFIGILILIVLLLLPFAMVFMGAIYIHDCASQPMIPIFNITCGSVIILMYIFNIMYIIFNNRDDNEEPPDKLLWINSFLILFILGWLIAGIYWVFSVSNVHCNKVLHQFSVEIIVCFCIFGCAVIATICRALVECCRDNI